MICPYVVMKYFGENRDSELCPKPLHYYKHWLLGTNGPQFLVLPCFQRKEGVPEPTFAKPLGEVPRVQLKVVTDLTDLAFTTALCEMTGEWDGCVRTLLVNESNKNMGSDHFQYSNPQKVVNIHHSCSAVDFYKWFCPWFPQTRKERFGGIFVR